MSGRKGNRVPGHAFDLSHGRRRCPASKSDRKLQMAEISCDEVFINFLRDFWDSPIFRNLWNINPKCQSVCPWESQINWRHLDNHLEVLWSFFWNFHPDFDEQKFRIRRPSMRCECRRDRTTHKNNETTPISVHSNRTSRDTSSNKPSFSYCHVILFQTPPSPHLVPVSNIPRTMLKQRQ